MQDQSCFSVITKIHRKIFFVHNLNSSLEHSLYALAELLGSFNSIRR